MLDIVGEKETSDRWRDLINPHKWAAEFQSQLTPANEFDRTLNLKPEQVGLEDMLRQTYGSSGRRITSVWHGTIDPLTFARTSDDSFYKAWGEVSADGGTMKGFEAYGTSLRAIELEARGVKSGLTDDQLKAAQIATTGKAKAQYARGWATYQRVKNAAMEYVKDSGLWSEDKLNTIREMNQNHTSFARIMQPKGFGSRGFLTRNPVRRIAGSENQKLGMVQADIGNLYTMIAMANRNRARARRCSQVPRQRAALSSSAISTPRSSRRSAVASRTCWRASCSIRMASRTRKKNSPRWRTCGTTAASNPSMGTIHSRSKNRAS